MAFSAFIVSNQKKNWTAYPVNPEINEYCETAHANDFHSMRIIEIVWILELFDKTNVILININRINLIIIANDTVI